jgi:hypothetical protein
MIGELLAIPEFWAIPLLVFAVLAIGASRYFANHDHAFELTLRHTSKLLAALVVAAAGARAAFDILVRHDLDQSAALYLGVPVLMAVVLATMAPATSCMRLSFTAVAAALLMALVVLREAWFCVAMAAPFMLGAGAIVGSLVDGARRRGGSAALALIPFALLGLEGTHPDLSRDRHEVVVASAVVDARPRAVEAALAAPPRFDRGLPSLLSIGFPRPTAGTVEGLRPGDAYTVEFTGGGQLVMEVVAHRAGLVVFRPIANTTPTADWLALTEARVQWQPVSGGRTRVTWSVGYDRLLDPAAYFGPLERVAMERAAAYLIESVVTP